MKSVGIELKDRIEITVEHYWNWQFAADLVNAFENALNRCARSESTLGCQLIHNSVSERIGKRQPELKQIRAGFLQRERQIDRTFQVWVTRTDVRDKALALC